MASGDRKLARLFNSKDFEQFRVLIRDGRTVAQAAAVLEFSPQTIYRHLRDDEGWRDIWREDVKFALELKADRVRGEWDERSFDREDPASARLLMKQIETYVPEARAIVERPPEDERADRIAEALDRFTSTVVSLASRGRAELPAGEPG